LAQLKGMPGLTTLWLEDTRVTDAGLVYVKELPALTSLWLGGKATQPWLAGTTALWLADTKITDSGMTHLKGLTSLTQLNIRGTTITDAGASELRKALPNLEIRR
jgi:internalin A